MAKEHNQMHDYHHLLFSHYVYGSRHYASLCNVHTRMSLSTVNNFIPPADIFNGRCQSFRRTIIERKDERKAETGNGRQWHLHYALLYKWTEKHSMNV